MVKPPRSHVSASALRSNQESAITNGREPSSGSSPKCPAVFSGWVIASTSREPGARDAGDLSNTCFHLVNVLEAHEGHCAVGHRVSKRECGSITQHDGTPRTRVGRSGHGHRPRPIDPNDLMTKTRQITPDTAFAAANVERQTPRGRHQWQKRVPVKPPIAVMTRRPRPGDPIVGVGLPRVRASLPHCAKRSAPLPSGTVGHAELSPVRQHVRHLLSERHCGTRTSGGHPHGVSVSNQLLSPR